MYVLMFIAVLLAILNLNYWCDSEEEKQEILNGFVENEKLKKLAEKDARGIYNIFAFLFLRNVKSISRSFIKSRIVHL